MEQTQYVSQTSFGNHNKSQTLKDISDPSRLTDFEKQIWQYYENKASTARGAIVVVIVW
jgi:hypothetical protein